MKNLSAAILSLSLVFGGFLNLKAQDYNGPEEDIELILENIKAFSKNVMASDAEGIGQAYSLDAKIFPNNVDIIMGRAAITEYWTFDNGRKIPYHKIIPMEITVMGDKAYDYGYYEGRSLDANGEEHSWKGKYVIVWKKVDGEWFIYLDIWNRIAQEQ